MNEKIHYDEFVEQISQKSGYDNDTVREYLSSMFETIVTESMQGNSVKLRNFGSFQPRWYKAKGGINPQTGQPLVILPHYHIHFASSKVLKNAVNDDSSRSFLPKLILASLLVLLVAILIYFMTLTSEPEKAKRVEQDKSTEKVVVKEDKPVEPIFEAVEEPKVEEPEELVIQKPEVIVQEPILIPKQSKTPLYPGSHTVVANETLSEIGSKIYGSKNYWPLLYTANSSNIVNPDLILKGSVLDVPDKTKSKPLYSSYMEVHNAYMEQDKMSKSFWVLCEGANFFGKDFHAYLKKELIPPEYAIIEVCSPKGL